jgi:hypothetical protein
LSARIDFDPYTTVDFGRVVRSWLPFVFAMNSVNRAIGGKNLYPFVLAPVVIEKLNFIHRLVQQKAQDATEEGFTAQRAAAALLVHFHQSASQAKRRLLLAGDGAPSPDAVVGGMMNDGRGQMDPKAPGADVPYGGPGMGVGQTVGELILTTVAIGFAFGL